MDPLGDGDKILEPKSKSKKDLILDLACHEPVLQGPRKIEAASIKLEENLKSFLQ